jgi:hypothetical protein
MVIPCPKTLVSGKDMNLWEILTAVNETVRKTPDSNMAKLVSKFEVKEYIAVNYHL